jgi:transcription initiation factor TFIIB
MEEASDPKLKLARTRLMSDRKKPSCLNCGAIDIIRDSSRVELICQQCGMVLDERRIDQGPDRHTYSNEGKIRSKHVGAPVDYTRSDKGLRTSIGWQDRDASGQELSPRNRAKIHRLRKWQRRARMHSNIQRNLAKAMFELHRLVSQLRLPNTVKKLPRFFTDDYSENK